MINNAVDLAQSVKKHATAHKKKRRGRRTLNDTLSEIRDFNEKNEMHLTYGQYIGLRDYGVQI